MQISCTRCWVTLRTWVEPSLYPRDRVDLGREVSMYTTPEALNLKYFLVYQLGHSIVGNHFFTFSPLSSSCLVVCISENVPQFPILRYYWRVSSEKVLTVRTRTFLLGMALSRIYGSSLSRRGSWWLQENSEECSTRPAIRRAGFPCHWECNCWHVIWNFYPTADEWLFQ